MNEKQQLKRPYQQHEAGSFIAQFELAIAPLRDQITRIEDTHAAIKKELKAIRIAIADSNRIARTSTVRASKAMAPVARAKRMNIKQIRFYAEIITHLKENFREVPTVEKIVLLSGGGMTVDNFRAYLARTFDNRIASEAYLTNFNLHSLVQHAGLGKVYKHTLLDRSGKDRLFLFYKIEKKEA
jgi:hypothetical protein